jgi:hypothetical protein
VNSNDPTPLTSDERATYTSPALVTDAPRPHALGTAADDDDDAEKVRFRLRDMITATTIFSVALALFKLIGLWGAFLSFLTAVAFTVYLSKARLPLYGRAHALAQRRIFKDFLWGVCMPIVCLVFDPMIFRNGGDPFDAGPANGNWSSLNDFGRVAYPLLGFQLAMMLLWLAAGWWLRRCAGFFAGVFLVGTAAAYLIGLCMLPISLFGLLFLGIGVLGFTPWLTGYAYLRRMRRANIVGKAHQNKIAYCGSLATGIVAAIVIPLVTTVLLFGDDAIQRLLR